MASRAVTTQSRPRFLWLLLLLLLALRAWLATTPGHPPDLHRYMRWALWGGVFGIHTLYDDPRLEYDYPPLYGYLLAPMGQLDVAIEPEFAPRLLHPRSANFARAAHSPTLSMLVKIPPLVFDLALAVLLAVLVRRYRLWGDRSSWAGWAPALILLFHPAVLFLSGHWGQPDSVETFFVLLALTLVLLRKPELGWVSAALGCLMKPLAAPYLPLLALATLLRSGWRRLLSGGLAGALAVVLGFTPFWWTGRGSRVFEQFFADIDAMPFTSVNGHNLWWLLGSWRPAGVPWLGPLTPKMIGLGAFAIAYGLVLAWLVRVERSRATGDDPPGSAIAGAPDDLAAQRHWYLAAAVVGFAFFTFSTHMHENHLVPVLPFLILLAGWGRRWVWLLGIAGLSMLLNMAIHDLFVAEHWLSGVGGVSRHRAPDIAWFLGHGGELSRGPFHSYLELYLSYANAVVVVSTFAVLLVWMLRSPRPSQLP